MQCLSHDIQHVFSPLTCALQSNTPALCRTPATSNSTVYGIPNLQHLHSPAAITDTAQSDTCAVLRLVCCAVIAVLCLQAPSVQQHLLDQNLVPFLLQEVSKELNSQVSAAGSNSSATVTAHLSQETPARNVSSLLQISRPPSKSTAAPAFKSLDLNRLAEGRMQPSGSPKVAAQYPIRGAVSDRQLGNATSSLKGPQISSTASAAPVSTKASGDLKFPPGFVSNGDMEDDLDRLMEMDSQVCNCTAARAYACE